tara:strand:- start:315 stop:1592 length:1278 start_codon:yes stop_codon:yes gene_type:complete
LKLTALDIGCFYHVYPGYGWEEMYHEQLGALVSNGLYDKLNHLHIGFNGRLDICSVPDKAVACSNENQQEETGTLKSLRDWAAANSESYILYFHTKGASRKTRFTEDWRKCMQYFCITNWRECYQALQSGYDLVGINWQEDTSMGYHPHFSGGFWWAKAAYINTLTDKELDSTFRYDREFWIGTGEPKVKNLWESAYNNKRIANHYRQPYSKSIYTKNYMTAQEHMDLPHWHEPDKRMVELLNHLNINGFEYPGGTDKATIHNYTGIYAYLLEQYQDIDCNLLEIGVQYGGSALLWHEYLPKCWMDLVDLKDQVNDVIWDQLDEDRFDFYETNAYSATALRTLGNKKYHVIIDDGSHHRNDLKFVAQNYYQMLEPGGVMILEDIPDEGLLEELTNLFSPKEQEGVRVFDVRESGRFDDLIWAIIK